MVLHHIYETHTRDLDVGWKVANSFLGISGAHCLFLLLLFCVRSAAVFKPLFQDEIWIPTSCLRFKTKRYKMFAFIFYGVGPGSIDNYIYIYLFTARGHRIIYKNWFNEAQGQKAVFSIRIRLNISGSGSAIVPDLFRLIKPWSFILSKNQVLTLFPVHPKNQKISQRFDYEHLNDCHLSKWRSFASGSYAETENGSR